MKRFFIFAAILAGVLSLGACQKEIKPVEEIGYHTVSFTASISETKTVLDGNHAKWCSADAELFNVFEVYSTTTTDEDNQETVSEIRVSADEVTVNFNETYTVASVNAKFADYTGNGTFSGYDAVVAKTLSNSNNPKVQSEQTPSTNSYDPTADVLVARRISSGDNAELKFVFDRPVSINKMTLKGLESGESISSVLLSTDKDSFDGYYSLNTGKFTSGNNKSIKCFFNDAIIGTEGTLVVYFVSSAGDFTPSITVVSEKNIYTKDFTRAISFGANDLHSFTVNLTGCGTPISADKAEYTLVDSNDDLFSGATYIIVGKKSEEYYAMGYQNTNNRPAVAIPAPEGDVISIDNTVFPYLFKIENIDNTWTIKDVTPDSESLGEFLYAAGTAATKSNYLKSAEIGENSYWTITFSDGVPTIKSVNNDKTPYLQFNSGSTLFSCYNTASQSAISLYVDKTTCVVDTTPCIIVSATSLVLDSDGNTDQAITVSGNDYLTSTISVTVPEDAQDWLEADVEEGELVVVADENTSSSSRSTTITLSAEGAESVEISITQEAPAAKHSVVFSVNGVEGAAVQYAEGESIEFPEDPVIDGVVFMGWSESAINGTQAAAPSFATSPTMGNADITYFAVFATRSGSEATSTLSQTLTYDTWTYFGSTTDKSSYRLFHSDSYIESAEFDLSKLSKVIVYGGTFGGGSYNSLTIGDGSNTWKNVTVSGSSQTGMNEYTGGQTLSGNGKLRITSNSGTASSTGVRISKIEIYIISGGYEYSNYCTTVGEIVTLSSITVSGTPDEFWKGDDFNINGMTVKATYSDNSVVDVTSDATFSTPDMTTAGEKTVTVTYDGQTATYTINVQTIANTVETAYSASKAIELIDAGKDLATPVFVKGIVCEIVTPFSSDYGNISFNVSADGTTAGTPFQFYRNQLSQTEKYTSDPNISVGDEVIGVGILKKYGSTYEFDAGNYLVSHKTSELEDATWSVSPNEISVTVGESDAVATITTNYNGTLNVTSNDTSKATVSFDATNKMITVHAVAAGSTTISVTGAATATYKALNKTIKVTVEDNSLVTETLIVGTNGNCTWSNSNKTASATVGAVTFTALGTGGNDGKYYSSDTSWRFYTATSSGVKVSVPSGKTIAKVVIKWKTGQPVTPNGFTADGTKSPTTYTANDGINVREVSFVRNNSSNLLIQEIEVSYK